MAVLEFPFLTCLPFMCCRFPDADNPPWFFRFVVRLSVDNQQDRHASGISDCLPSIAVRARIRA